MMFIKRLGITGSVSEMNNALREILDVTDWGDKNQIGLNYRAGAIDTWHDAAGSLYDKVNGDFISKEADFTHWNKLPVYIKEQLQLLIKTENINVGRVRIMRLLPKSGLSIHRDREFRYHFVIKTNSHAYIAHELLRTVPELSDVDTTSISYHLPADGTWYKVDTTQNHYVYNGGSEERIHLVVCG